MKNNNKNARARYIVIAACFLFILTAIYSCKKYLDIKPVGSLSSGVLANKAGVDGLLIGAYAMLDGVSNSNNYTSWYTSTTNWAFGGIASDDAYKGSSTTDQPTASPLANHTVDASNDYVGQKWGFCYNAIQRANDVLRELPLVTDGSVTPEYAAEVTAEARFLRGFFHLELAKLWHNVPYVNETVTYSAKNFVLPNSGPIWDSIENDFSAAMNVLPKTQSEVGRVNYYAAEAFLAETYMFDHQYATALPLLTDLIDNGETSSGDKYALGPFEDNFDAAHRNNPESVFCVQMTLHDGSGGFNSDQGDMLNYPSVGTAATCCGFYEPSFSLGNAYKVDANGLPMLQTDPNATTWPPYDDVNLKNDLGLASPTASFTPATDALDPRIDWTLGRRGIPFLDWGLCGGFAWVRGDPASYLPKKNIYWQYNQASVTETGQGWGAGQSNAINYNLIRFSDVILWRAECEVEANDLQTAEDDVNMVRDRMADHHEYWVHQYLDNSDPLGGFYTDDAHLAANYKIGLYGAAGGHASTGFVAMGKDYARAAVYMERQLELAMEGHRFFDLQRYDGTYGGPMPKGYMANVLNAFIKADTRAPFQNPILDGHTFTAGKNELYPIPQSQVDIEAGVLVQNPGY